MKRPMRRRGVLPFTFAALLTVAAGLSLAEEHALVPAVVPAVVPEGSVTSSDLSGKGAKGAMPDARPHKAVSDRHPGARDGHAHKAAARKPGAGSRALAGHDEQEPATPERPNTDADTHLDGGSQSLD
jgi:hypothetical protein